MPRHGARTLSVTLQRLVSQARGGTHRIHSWMWAHQFGTREAPSQKARERCQRGSFGIMAVVAPRGWSISSRGIAPVVLSEAADCRCNVVLSTVLGTDGNTACCVWWEAERSQWDPHQPAVVDDVLVVLVSASVACLQRCTCLGKLTIDIELAAAASEFRAGSQWRAA